MSFINTEDIRRGFDIPSPNGIAADYGSRLLSIALVTGRGLLGFNQRPGQATLQKIANTVPIDGKEYDAERGSIPTILNDIQKIKSSVLSAPGDFLAKLISKPLVLSVDHSGSGLGGTDLVRQYKILTTKPISDRYNQVLDEKGFITLEYPGEDSLLKIPFFENPIINESRNARYASNNIFNRNEPIRLYTGSEARKFTVNLKYTMPHVYEFMKRDLYNEYLTEESVRDLKNLVNSNVNLLREANLDRISEDSTSYVKAITTQTREDYNASSQAFARRDGKNTTNQIGIHRHEDTTGYKGRALGYQSIDTVNFVRNDERFKMQQFMYIIINAIRSSVIGSVNKLQFGPPIARLNFGALYSDVPCIVTQYKFKFDGDSGYELDTLIPRVFEVNLSLEEYRQSSSSGNLTTDKYDRETNKDGLPGWDTFISQLSLDPPFTL